MNNQSSFEARLAEALGEYADRAPTEMDPISITAAVAHRSMRRWWPTLPRHLSWLVAGTVLILLAVVAGLIAGSQLLRVHAAIGGGGLILIDQVEAPASDLTRPTAVHLFGLDVATGNRLPIADPPLGTFKRSWGWMATWWSPDRSHALVVHPGGGLQYIVDVAGHRLSEFELRATDTYNDVAGAGAWAPTSDRVATVVHNDTTNLNGTIVIFDLAGRQIQRRAMPAGWAGQASTWSPDASSLILRAEPLGSSAEVHLLLVPLDGSPPRVFPLSSAYYGPAAWSPDGSTIAVESSIGIQIVDVATGRQTAITHGKDASPSWSPDGHQLAYMRSDGQGGSTGIYVAEVDGSNVRQLTSGVDGNPVWSPDGTMVVFTRQHTSPTGQTFTSDVWVVGSDGARPRLLVEYAAADW